MRIGPKDAIATMVCRPGDVLGPYTILQMLGRGSFSHVLLGQDYRRPSQCVALKVVHCDHLDGEAAYAAKEEAIAEARLLQRLRHPNIVSCHEVCWDDQRQNVWFALDFMDGGDMQTLIDSRRRAGKGPPEQEVMRRTLSAVGSALMYIHAESVLHRDVKPSNILLSRDLTEIRLADFGVSKILLAASQAHTFVGTPYYSSPELVSGEPYGASSDTWALGVCLYELIALRRPFEAENQLALACQIVQEEPPPLPADYAPELVRIVSGLLIKDPGKRLQLAEAMSLTKPSACVERSTRHPSGEREVQYAATAPSSSNEFLLNVVLPSTPAKAQKQNLLCGLGLCQGGKNVACKERKSRSCSRSRPRWPRLRLNFRSKRSRKICPISVEPVMCPDGHLLEQFPAPSSTCSCNACSQIVVLGSIMWGCRTCNYDLCSFCSCGEAPWKLRDADESDDVPLTVH